MTKSGKCLWIINTLISAAELSLRELNERWEQSTLYDGKPLHERTFLRYRQDIATDYNIEIGYSPSTNKYFLENRAEIKDDVLYKYLLSAYRIAELNTQALKHRTKLMLEPTPTGTEHLAPLLQAIDTRRTVLFNYTSYYSPDPQDWELTPCFLRIFEGRWYLIAEYMNRAKIRVFALERISNLRIGEKELLPSPEITPEIYYQGCYGIIRDDCKPRLIHLRADKEQRCYLRAQPLHESQEEVEIAADSSIFTYYLRPSFDLFQKILWMREKVEILGPDDVREKMAAIVNQLSAMYK